MEGVISWRLCGSTAVHRRPREYPLTGVDGGGEVLTMRDGHETSNERYLIVGVS